MGICLGNFFFAIKISKLKMDTVDGSEIRRSPVEVGSLFHYQRQVLYIPGACLGFLPSTIAPQNWMLGRLSFLLGWRNQAGANC